MTVKKCMLSDLRGESTNENRGCYITEILLKFLTILLRFLKV